MHAWCDTCRHTAVCAFEAPSGFEIQMRDARSLLQYSKVAWRVAAVKCVKSKLRAGVHCRPFRMKELNIRIMCSLHWNTDTSILYFSASLVDQNVLGVLRVVTY